MEQPTVMKYTAPSGRVIFFEKEKDLSNIFVEAKKYMNSVFLESGTFEYYAFNRHYVQPASEEEKDMFVQMRDRSVHLIGKT